jgi:ribosomal protein S18 acetylase RimI-like enzyme
MHATKNTIVGPTLIRDRRQPKDAAHERDIASAGRPDSHRLGWVLEHAGCATCHFPREGCSRAGAYARIARCFANAFRRGGRSELCPGRSCGSHICIVAARKMSLEFREARLADPKSLAGIRAATEARALLLRLGIKLPANQGEFLTGSIKLWECADNSQVVGHCSGNVATGEVLSLSVHPGYEGRGIGRELLSLVVNWLREAGPKRIWLLAPSDPSLRAFGFYRAMGWQPTGEQLETGNEVLEFPLKE